MGKFFNEKLLRSNNLFDRKELEKLRKDFNVKNMDSPESAPTGIVSADGGDEGQPLVVVLSTQDGKRATRRVRQKRTRKTRHN